MFEPARTIVPLPTLDDLASDPGLAAGLPPDATRRLACRALGALQALHLQLASEEQPNINTHQYTERLLSAGQVAELLGQSERWVRKHRDELPPPVPGFGRSPRWREMDIQRWIQTK